MSMLAVKPIDVDDTKLNTSTIPEPDIGETVWAAGSYNTGDEVISTNTHFVYRSNIDSNTQDPESASYDKLSPGGVSTNWTIIRYTNRYRMFDTVIGAQSSGVNVSVSITPSEFFNAVAGLNVTGATSVNITMTDPNDGEVYNKDIDMINNAAVVDYYEYFFTPIVNVSEFAVFDLPPYPNATIEVTIGGADVGVGELVVGSQINIGVLQAGCSWEPVFFGRRERDEFGNYIIDDRGSADIFSYNVKVTKQRAAYIKQQLRAIGNSATLWVDPDVDGTLSYGYYDSINLNFATPTLYDMTLNVQGII